MCREDGKTPTEACEAMFLKVFFFLRASDLVSLHNSAAPVVWLSDKDGVCVVVSSRVSGLVGSYSEPSAGGVASLSCWFFV